MAKKYLRMTLNERIQHLNLAINFTILVITGFALKYPEAFWASPITDVPLGMTFRGFCIVSPEWPRLPLEATTSSTSLLQKGGGGLSWI